MISSGEIPLIGDIWAGTLLPYASGTGWRATELRYAGGPRYGDAPLAMTFVLPDDLPAFEASLTAAQLSRITAALAAQRTALTRTAPCPGENPLGCECSPYGVDLFLPRFSIDTRAGLNDALRALGMPLAFDPSADFTGIHQRIPPVDQLYISTVIHQANIDVDEKGTEAAAATAVAMTTGGGCGGTSVARTITLRLDHPFLFFVRDLATGAVLFMGQVTDPSA